MLKPWKRRATDINTSSSPQANSHAMNDITHRSFPDLSVEQVQLITHQLKPKALEKDEALFFKGMPVDHWYFVTKGALESEHHDQRFVEGDWVTDISLDLNDTHQLTLRATEATALLYLSLKSFEQLPDEIKHYLKKGLLSRLNKRHAETLGLNRQLIYQNQLLKQALFDANTQHMGEFVKSPTAQQVLAKVPRLPVSSMQLLSKLLDPNSSQQEVVELIRQDPSLTSTLLKSINSPSYGLENKISDIQHATSLLGIDSVYQIVVSDSMRSSLPDTEFFRENHSLSLEISHLAFVVAQLSQQGKPAELATLGLMSQIGEVVVELLKTQSPKLASLFAQVDTASMGSALLKSWSLPSTISEPLAFKHYPHFSDPENIPQSIRAAVAILYLASLFRSLLRKEDISRRSLFLNEYLTLLNLDHQSIEITLRDKVIPALKKRRLGLPLSLRQLIES